MTHPHHSHRHHQQRHERVQHILGHREHGGSADETSDKAMIRKAFTEHDAQLHGGKKTRLKLASGGAAEGEQGHRRLDRGGRKGASHVNVIVAPGAGGGQQPAMAPRPVPVPVPVRPPMGGPTPGAMGPGGPPGMPPGMPPGLAARPGMGPPGVPPGMPIRAAGGRVRRASGGKVDASSPHGIEEPKMPHMEESARSALGRAAKSRAMGGIKSALAAGD